MTRTSCALTVRGLTVTDERGQFPLQDFDFDASAGEIVALVGPSGSGKTTAMSALLGSLPHGLTVTAGSIDWSGAGSHGTRAWRREAVGYAAQDPSSALHPRYPAWRSVAEAARMRGLSRASATASARALLAELGLTGDQIESPPHRLSGGQAQRIAVARALVATPELVILDEPSSGLDDASLEPVLAAVTSRRRSNGVTIVVTHDRRMLDVCDRVLRTAPDADFSLGSSARFLRPSRTALELSSFGVDTHRGRVLVEDAALDIGVGELVVVRGPSGCGKTTLLRAVCGLHAFHGVMTLDGLAVPERVGERTPQTRAAIALVGQNPLDALNPAHTIERILRRHISRVRPHAYAIAEAEHLLDRVALPATALRKRPHELSGGQRQRVAIARALAGRPRLLVADEMTASLDHNTASRINDLLDEIRSSGTDLHGGMAILAATHDEHLISRADRVIEIRDRSITEVVHNMRSTQR
ncbi:MAG: ATP-binding cassette domain-containing protein [Rhodococcus sp. (in: high G+C Gram-positive bacteria)]